jgi:DNA-binding response OmpR family regulator
MKILIADDDAIFRSSLARVLSADKHDVVAAHTGQEAWEYFVKDPVKLIISDWIMPELSGLELCRKIRRDRSKDYCYFILLTANTGRAEYEEAMDAGVDDFLVKPIDAHELFIRLRVAQRILNSTARIKRLETLLPICSYCKRIRGDNGDWTQLEAYMPKHAEAAFSHGICPQCMEEVDLEGE